MSLIERLEAAEVGGEIEDEIHDLLCDSKRRTCIVGLTDEQGGMWVYSFAGHNEHSALRVTRSLDAALALAERVLPRSGDNETWEVSLYKAPGKTQWFAGLRPYGSGGVGSDGNTPALALCIAILKAKETK